MDILEILNRKPEDQLLTRKDAAAYLGLKEGTLAVWATTRRYMLPYIKIGSAVRYRRGDLDSFIEAHRTGGQHEPA